MWYELKQVQGIIMRIGIFFLVATVISLSISVQWYHPLFLSIPFFGDSAMSIPAYFIQSVQEDLLSAGVRLAVTTPLEAFSVYMGIGVSFALVITLLYASWELWRFASPGLYRAERKGFAAVLVASFILLYAGALFGYHVVIPVIYKGLHAFIPAGIVPLYSLGDLVWQVIGLMFACALSFLMPVAMFLLSAFGIVPETFWRAHWRHALFAALIITAIITPDGSGASMVVTALPLCLLYILGYVASVYYLYARRKHAPHAV